MRASKWLSLIALIVSSVWSTNAWAQAGGGGPSIEFLVSATITILLALAHGYSRGVDRRVGVVESRVTLVEHEQRQQQQQMSMIREGMPMNYHTKADIERVRVETMHSTNEHRERVEAALQHINTRLDAMSRQPNPRRTQS